LSLAKRLPKANRGTALAMSNSSKFTKLQQPMLLVRHKSVVARVRRYSSKDSKMSIDPAQLPLPPSPSRQQPSVWGAVVHGLTHGKPSTPRQELYRHHSVRESPTTDEEEDPGSPPASSPPPAISLETITVDSVPSSFETLIVVDAALTCRRTRYGQSCPAIHP
jgi:hypothetical protein